MGARILQRMQWRLACALFAAVGSAADITPTNSSTSVRYDGTINLQHSTGANITVSNDNNAVVSLVPLTSDATSRNLNGELFLLDSLNSATVPRDSIVYITCDSSPGYIAADDILKSVYNSDRAQGAILYSTESDYCGYNSSDDSISGYAIYSTTNGIAAQFVKDELEAENQSTKYFVRVTRSGTQDTQDEQQDQNTSQPQNPLGPSPSTAVAMIILYSITGVITALFLVIIVTGAVRAHRHPDRYGPRDGTGRPTRSRARGLGMAILDTIPIVKFGERDQPKPADVELGSTSEARDVNAATADTTTPATPETRRDASTEPPRSPNTTQVDALDSGIAPAQPVAAAAVTQPDSTDEGLGCSICTDDFEKGQDIRVLPCNHKFHPECVDPWLLNVSGTCPLCRVDLRPTTSHTTSSSSDPDALAPPLQSDEASHRRHSTLRDVLSFRSRPNASADERISALRRLREQRRNQSGEAVEGSADASSEDVAARERRSRRVSARFSGVFGARRRREESAERDGSPSGTPEGERR